MSWVFPPNRARNTLVFDIGDINEDLVQFANEMSGKLNEHNFLFGFAASPTPSWRLEDDAGLVVSQVGLMSNPLTSPPDHVFSMKETWHPVPTQLVMFTSSGGLLWILSSFQARIDPGISAFDFVLEIDGSILYESLWGSGDLSNDQVESAPGVADFGPGASGEFLPIVLEASVRLLPGEHTVRLMSKALQAYNITGAVPGAENAELIVIEMLR